MDAISVPLYSLARCKPWMKGKNWDCKFAIAPKTFKIPFGNGIICGIESEFYFYNKGAVERLKHLSKTERSSSNTDTRPGTRQ